jgi:hypothetical protein
MRECAYTVHVKKSDAPGYHFHIRGDEQLYADLDFSRKQEGDLPSRAEMVRRLIEREIARVKQPESKKRRA